MKYIIESSNKLLEDIKKFLNMEFYPSVKFSDLIHSCELAKGNCDQVSEELYVYLLEIGYPDDSLIMVDLYNPKFDLDKAHHEWRDHERQHLVHTILKVGNIYVDLTGAQYSPELGGIKLYHKRDLKELWGNYKLMKRDGNGDYIGGSTKPKMMRF